MVVYETAEVLCIFIAHTESKTTSTANEDPDAVRVA